MTFGGGHIVIYIFGSNSAASVPTQLCQKRRLVSLFLLPALSLQLQRDQLFWRLERLAQAVVDCHPNVDAVIPLSQMKRPKDKKHHGAGEVALLNTKVDQLTPEQRMAARKAEYEQKLIEQFTDLDLRNTGAVQVMSHPFFREINWRELYLRNFGSLPEDLRPQKSKYDMEYHQNRYKESRYDADDIERIWE